MELYQECLDEIGKKDEPILKELVEIVFELAEKYDLEPRVVYKEMLEMDLHSVFESRLKRTH